VGKGGGDKMRKITLITFVLITAVLIGSVGAENYAGYAGAFLRNGLGARPMGMGGAYTAVAEGPEATYYNPAGLGYINGITIRSSYKSLSLDRHFGHFSVAFPIRNEASMAASWVNAGVSDVPAIDRSRIFYGDVSNSSNAFALSFAKVLHPKFSFGANLKYIQEKIDEAESFTIGLDIGALSKVHEFVTIGALFQNLGSKYKWDSSNVWRDGSDYDESFPVVMKFGVSGNILKGSLIPAIDLETSNNSELKFRAGSEYWLTKTVIRQVEDEYEEDVMINVEEQVKIAGLRIGLDRGSPTFGGSFFYEVKNISVGVEYAYLIGREGTPDGHVFTFGLGF
jgi:hypothetical protein